MFSSKLWQTIFNAGLHIIGLRLEFDCNEETTIFDEFALFFRIGLLKKLLFSLETKFDWKLEVLKFCGEFAGKLDGELDAKFEGKLDVELD